MHSRKKTRCVTTSIAIQKENVLFSIYIFYRESPVEGFDGVKAQREIERFAMEREGIVALYAESQLTEEEFHQMFNVEGLIENYYKLRRKLGCENAFPTIYQKVSKLGRSMQPK